MEADTQRLPEILSPAQGSLSSCGKQVRTPLGTSEWDREGLLGVCL